MNQHEVRPSKLAVLTATPSRYLEFERFLMGRGWTLRMQNDLKLFLEDVTRLKPDYVLISVDYDTSKMPHLRHLLQHVYRATVIEFAEEQSVPNWERLKKLPALTRLLGPLTGPAFERLLVSIAQTKEQRTPHKNKLLHLHFGIMTLLKKKLKSRGQVLSHSVTEVRKITCYQVEAQEFSGHFLVATGSDRVLENEIQEMLRVALRDLVEGLYEGPKTPEVEIFEVEIPPVNFKKFAARSADFFSSGLHRGIEVVMAYFPVEANWAGLEEKASFIQIDLLSNCVHHPAPCALYLHLPLNDKFILYVAENNFLEPKQEINLQNHGVTKLYARDEDRPKLYRRCAGQRYAELIRRFREAA